MEFSDIRISIIREPETSTLPLLTIPSEKEED